jgi:hypothetical protein
VLFLRAPPVAMMPVLTLHAGRSGAIARILPL